MTQAVPAPHVLTTERLILTPVAAGDFEDLRRTWSDPDFVRAITGRPLSAEEVWFRLLRDIGHWSTLGHGNWSMRTRDTGAYVGGVGLFDYRRDLVPPFTAPEVGWGVAVGFQGRGLAHEGLARALAWADARPMPRTVCMIDPDNARSLNLAARVGYRPYADGVYKDKVMTLFERVPTATAS